MTEENTALPLPLREGDGERGQRALCRLDELLDGGCKGFGPAPGGFTGLFAVRQGDQVLVYVNSCPHIGTPLDFVADRFFTRNGKHLLCGTHGALFRPEDGLCIAGPCLGRRLFRAEISVEDGAVMFMSRLVHSPNDTMIYGRAIGQRYEEGRDDASPADLAKRPWKKDWPHYIRVRDGEFLDGTMGDGVSLVELMDELGPHAFASPSENLESGSGNTDPRMSIRQSAAVRLAPAGIDWLNERLEHAFQGNGQLQPAELASLDWPFEIDGTAG